MKKIILLSSIINLFVLSASAQGICDPAGNTIFYSNYDGGDITINVDEDVPDLRIGICSYRSINITITGTYVSNVTQVTYAGYDDDGTTNITGVDAALTDIIIIPLSTIYDPDGYAYIICAYECDTAYIPGGCNTVDQITDYFMTELGGVFRFSYMQYVEWASSSYDISDGGNCCFSFEPVADPVDVGISALISPEGGCSGSEEIITVTIQNFGSTSVTSIPVNYSIDGDPEITATASITIAAGATADYSFTTTADISTSGVHTIEAWTNIAGDADASNDMLSTNVTTLASPSLDLGDSQIVCDEVELDAENPGSAYSWNTGETTQSIFVTESGTYSVTVTNLSTGCSVTDAVEITVNYDPITSFTYTVTGLTIDFTNTSSLGTSYTWDFGDGSGSSSVINPSYTYSEPGVYTVTLTVGNECGTDDYTTQITVGEVAIEESTLISGTNIYPNPVSGITIIDMNFDKSYDVNMELLNTAGEVVWKFSPGIIRSGSFEIDMSAMAAGVYQLQCIADDQMFSKQIVLIK